MPASFIRRISGYGHKALFERSWLAIRYIDQKPPAELVAFMADLEQAADADEEAKVMMFYSAILQTWYRRENNPQQQPATDSPWALKRMEIHAAVNKITTLR